MHFNFGLKKWSDCIPSTNLITFLPPFPSPHITNAFVFLLLVLSQFHFYFSHPVQHNHSWMVGTLWKTLMDLKFFSFFNIIRKQKSKFQLHLKKYIACIFKSQNASGSKLQGTFLVCPSAHLEGIIFISTMLLNPVQLLTLICDRASHVLV